MRVLSAIVSIVLLCDCSNGGETALLNAGGTSAGGAPNAGGSVAQGGDSDSGGSHGNNGGASGAAGSSGAVSGNAGEAGGAGAAGDGGSGGSAGGGACKQNILLVLDASLSMLESEIPSSGAGASMTKWAAAVSALEEVIAERPDLGWGLKLFPLDVQLTCHTDSVSAGVEVPIGPADAVLQAIAQTTPLGFGTPTAQALQTATTYLSSLPNSTEVVTLLVTDGVPSCTCLAATEGTCDDSIGAGPLTEQALGNAADLGFRTSVVGVAGSESARASLNGMALAGEALWSPNPLASAFLADFHEDLAPLLRTAIERAVANCGGTPGPACPAAGGVIVSEDFEGAVAAPQWIPETAGGWNIVTDGSNHAYEAVSFDSGWVVGGNISCANQTLEAKVRLAAGDELALLALRVTDLDSLYFIEVISDRIKLRKRAGGGTVDLAEADLTPFAAGAWHTVRFSAIGTALSVSFDSTEVITLSDPELVSGGVAFGSGDPGVAFDDLIVTSNP